MLAAFFSRLQFNYSEYPGIYHFEIIDYQNDTIFFDSSG
jgi:hypothetical protein